jgi:hypothetical protein
MTCSLVDRKWLYRRFEVVTREGSFVVEYNGRPIGYECVRVEERVVARIKTYVWFAPRFEFAIGTLPAVIEVRVRPWLAMQCRLSVGDEVLYSDRA